ncbi:MAG: metallophosphoesterase [Actinomycetia bacterium]|nr:metallophosphoesterase [Actinomycetes bacterium]
MAKNSNISNNNSTVDGAREAGDQHFDIQPADTQHSAGARRPVGRVRRIALVSLGMLGLVSVLAHLISALTLDRLVEYREVTFHSPAVSAELQGLRVAFITDVHDLSPHNLQDIVDQLNQSPIDLVVLGGDFSTDTVLCQQQLAVLATIAAPAGIFGVPGNHDDATALTAAMAECGITALNNDGCQLNDNLYLAGVLDYWSGAASIQQAIQSADTGDFVLLISHNPDITMTQSTAGIDLILCGHTHGGQDTLFGLFAPALETDIITHYGQRFRSGWSTAADGTPVYVSNGLGVIAQIPRVFARPQVIIITLNN